MADDGDDEEYVEDIAELIQEFGPDPRMQAVHKALTDQLKDTHYRLQVQLREKQDESSAVNKEREVVGLQLYNLQQQLARIQTQLENSYSEYSATVDTRLQEEEITKNIMSTNSEKQALLNEYTKQQKKYNNELESLNETTRQIEKYIEEVKGEIAISRRTAYKTEQNMQLLEKHKEDQDMYVDNLNKQVKSLQDQIALLIGQYDSQKKETDDANTILQGTIKELEEISKVKKQLMVQWKTALSGLARRDEALSKANETLKVAENAVHDYDVEYDSVKRDIQYAQAKHESLVNLRDRLENELNWVEENLNKIKTERDQLHERYTILTKSLQQTDLEAKKLDLVAKQIGADAESLLSNLQIVTLERHGLEDAINATFSAKSNINKAIVNLRKQQSEILKKIHKMEMEDNEVDNDIAKATVDKLNITSMLDQLIEQHGVVMKELHDKEAMIAKYQLEIRQRNDEVEKKMYRVDRLNKKYEKMIESAGGEENLGPMENGIRLLNKETDGYNEESKDLERDWLRKQTELVAVSTEGDQLAEEKNEFQARVTILTQQQLRLTQESVRVKADVKAAQQFSIDLNKDVAKLNVLISANHETETDLQTKNYIIEHDCIEDLKNKEQECVQLQGLITETKMAKSKLLDEILEQERQALLWEKKIQLDKETREALDPSVGQQETENMEKEIHRMQLRYNALKREQQRLVSEMEAAVYKRAAITNRYSKSESSQESRGHKDTKDKTSSLTQAAAKKRIGSLKKEARIHTEELDRYNATIEEKNAMLHELSSDLERLTVQYSSTEELNHNLQGEVNDLLYKKQLNQERIAYKDKFLKRFKENVATGIDLTQSLQIERRLVSATQALDNVKEIIDNLTEEFPHLTDVFQRVSTMTDPCLMSSA